jgi:hypothetical protein
MGEGEVFWPAALPMTLQPTPPPRLGGVLCAGGSHSLASQSQARSSRSAPPSPVAPCSRGCSFGAGRLPLKDWRVRPRRRTLWWQGLATPCQVQRQRLVRFERRRLVLRRRDHTVIYPTIPALDRARTSFSHRRRSSSRKTKRPTAALLQGDSLRIDAIWRDEFNALQANPNVNSIRSINPESGAEVLLWSR